MDGYNLSQRHYVIGGAAVAIVFVYLLRLMYLQLFNGEYKQFADNNAFLNQVEYPARGTIFDRHGKVLVYNQPSYDVMVVMHDIRNLDTLDFCQSLNITKDYFVKRMADIKDRNKNPGYSPFTQQLFMNQIPAESYSAFQEKLFTYSGFFIQKRSVRQYSTACGAHVLGDVGEVSQANIDEDPYYQSGDYIGKLGVEKTYEKELRGVKGVQVLLRDAHGRIKGHYQNGKFDRAPIPGKNLTLGLDEGLQQLGERLLRGKIGAIVAIEPSTGQVLCMVSSPTYDPRLMVGRMRGKMHAMLSRNPWKPLLDRAIMGQYPPGSTFKTSQALTFLQEGIITPDMVFPCNHGFNHGGLHVGCHGHAGPLSLIPAIATSCNGYFCGAFYRFFSARWKYGNVHKAMDIWRDYMVSMGFGYKLGVDLPGEKRGLIPNDQFYNKAYHGSWNGLTIISDAIGQGEVNLTPLQVCNLAATIANRGYYYIPHVVKSVEGGQIDPKYYVRHYTKVQRKWYEYVVAGMRAAVTGKAMAGGTCKSINLPWVEICGKTGTAQNRGRDHSVFMGFAPMNNPKIAVSVYVENGGFGADFGVPIGGLMIEQYLRGKLSASSELRAAELQKRVIGYGKSSR